MEIYLAYSSRGKEVRTKGQHGEVLVNVVLSEEIVWCKKASMLEPLSLIKHQRLFSK